MGKYVTYKCDICRDPKPYADLMGVRFTDYRNFKLSDPSSTDGVHICLPCGRQLAKQLPDRIAGIPDRAAVSEDG